MILIPQAKIDEYTGRGWWGIHTGRHGRRRCARRVNELSPVEQRGIVEPQRPQVLVIEVCRQIPVDQPFLGMELRTLVHVVERGEVRVVQCSAPVGLEAQDVVDGRDDLGFFTASTASSKCF